MGAPVPAEMGAPIPVPIGVGTIVWVTTVTLVRLRVIKVVFKGAVALLTDVGWMGFVRTSVGLTGNQPVILTAVGRM